MFFFLRPSIYPHPHNNTDAPECICTCAEDGSSSMLLFSSVMCRFRHRANDSSLVQLATHTIHSYSGPSVHPSALTIYSRLVNNSTPFDQWQWHLKEHNPTSVLIAESNDRRPQLSRPADSAVWTALCLCTHILLESDQPASDTQKGCHAEHTIPLRG